MKLNRSHIIDIPLMLALIACAVLLMGCVKSDAKIQTDIKPVAKGVEKKDQSSNAGNQTKSDQVGLFNLSYSETAVGVTGAGVLSLAVLSLWLRSKAKEDQQETERHKALLAHFKDQQEANRIFAERLMEKHIKSIAEACVEFAKARSV